MIKGGGGERKTLFLLSKLRCKFILRVALRMLLLVQGALNWRALN